MDVLGQILASAYFDDLEFRQIIAPLNELLIVKSNQAMKSLSSDEGEVDFQAYLLAGGIQSNFNSYIVSSFHAARVCEMAFEQATRNFRAEGNPRCSNALMTLQHAFGIEALFNLSYTKNFITNPRFAEIAGTDPSNTSAIFDRLFPNLDEARNAVAHQEERALGVFGMGKKADKSKAPVMMHSMAGSTFLKLLKKSQPERDESPNYEEFDFSFATVELFKLVKELDKEFR